MALSPLLLGAIPVRGLRCPTLVSDQLNRLGAVLRRLQALLVLTVLALLGGCAGDDGAPPFEVVWVGDILLADAAQEELDTSGYEWPFQHLGALVEGDYLIGNGEGPITPLTEPYFADQKFEYNADPQSADALASVGFDAIGLSNNHILDRGPAGLTDTLSNLEAAGIHPFGAGLLANAEAPLLIETPHGVVAVMAFGEEWNAGAVASETTLGTVPLSRETIERGRQLAVDAGARWFVAYVHWGENYEGVDGRQRELAALFARAGYDLVIGHHPHVAQEIEVIDGMPVLYSVGNFTFGTPGRFDADAPGYGLVARTSFGSDDVPGIRLSCIVTDNDLVNFQPRPCSLNGARGLFSELGTAVVALDDGTAEVTTGP